MPNGLSIQPKSALSMGPGARAVPTAVDAPATAAIQPTFRQPGPGGAAGREQKRDKAEQQHERPAGMTSSRTRPHSRPPRVDPGARTRCASRRCSTGRRAPIGMTPAPISHPTGLRGRLAATTAPTTAKPEKTMR